MPTTYHVYLRQPDGSRGPLIEDYEGTLIQRFNDAGSWELTVPADSEAGTLADFGWGIEVERLHSRRDPNDSPVLFGGPISLYRRRVAESGDTLTIGGPDDIGLLLDRAAVPVPDAEPDPSGATYSAASHDVRTGALETVLGGYVNANAGPGATQQRQSALTVTGSLGRGPEVRVRARFDPLLELLQTLIVGNEFGFRVVRAGGAPRFEVYQPRDRSAEVEFSQRLGNLGDVEYEVIAPTANHIYILGGGRGTARIVLERSDEASIRRFGRRIEKIIDARDTTDLDELHRRLDKALAENAARISLKLAPIDTEALAFGVDYRLGDIVAVTLPDGQIIRDALTEVRIDLGPEGEDVVPVVGRAGGGEDDADDADDLGRRIGRLERAE